MAPPDSLFVAQSIQMHALLNLQFVVLPDPYDARTWVVDLRDIGHPLTYSYPTPAVAEAARLHLIHEALIEAINGPVQSV
jgi:hypothetical protein